MWSIWVDGVEHRLDDLPVGVILDLERRLGVKASTVNPRVHTSHARALAEVLGVDPDTIRLTQFRPSTFDQPTYWTDGRPTGGRTLDGWIAQMCRPPWSFTPRQIREDFTLRDLELLIGSVDA